MDSDDEAEEPEADEGSHRGRLGGDDDLPDIQVMKTNRKIYSGSAEMAEF